MAGFSAGLLDWARSVIPVVMAVRKRRLWGNGSRRHGGQGAGSRRDCSGTYPPLRSNKHLSLGGHARRRHSLLPSRRLISSSTSQHPVQAGLGGGLRFWMSGSGHGAAPTEHHDDGSDETEAASHGHQPFGLVAAGGQGDGATADPGMVTGGVAFGCAGESREGRGTASAAAVVRQVMMPAVDAMNGVAPIDRAKVLAFCKAGLLRSIQMSL